MLSLDFVQTVAFAGLVLFLGYAIRGALPWLARFNVPAPVVGGLSVAAVLLVARQRGVTPVTFDTQLQIPLMIAFFTTVGFGASLSLLRVGGPQVMLFFFFSTVVAILQNLVGVVVAQGLGEHPLLGIMAGSVTLTGGPATGLAFAPDFERAGLAGASTLAVASAMVGIVGGGLIGGPIGTLLIERRRLKHATAAGVRSQPEIAEHVVEDALDKAPQAAPKGEDVEAYGLLKALVIILVAMWGGSWVSAAIQENVRFPAFIPGLGGRALTLPAYIGAMLVAAGIRNLDDMTGWLGLSQRVIDDLGSVALALFLALALMTLRLWELAGLALPLIVILIAQLALVAAVAFFLVFRLMGRDYESAVTSAGFVGFMLGTTANAMASMETITARYGPAPRAYLIVPMVGAFFIDFTNAVLITVCLNIWS
jgi:ESS family glutamate:Na+ symporter